MAILAFIIAKALCERPVLLVELVRLEPFVIDARLLNIALQSPCYLLDLSSERLPLPSGVGAADDDDEEFAGHEQHDDDVVHHKDEHYENEHEAKNVAHSWADVVREQE